MPRRCPSALSNSATASGMAATGDATDGAVCTTPGACRPAQLRGTRQGPFGVRTTAVEAAPGLCRSVLARGSRSLPSGLSRAAQLIAERRSGSWAGGWTCCFRGGNRRAHWRDRIPASRNAPLRSRVADCMPGALSRLSRCGLPARRAHHTRRMRQRSRSQADRGARPDDRRHDRKTPGAARPSQPGCSSRATA